MKKTMQACAERRAQRGCWLWLAPETHLNSPHRWLAPTMLRLESHSPFKTV